MGFSTLFLTHKHSFPLLTSQILIAGRPVGSEHPPFVIAEMSGNHNQSLDRALELVEAAAQSGAHAIKLQTFYS